ARRRNTGASERARQLVERVVPADILAQREEAAAWLPKARRVHGMGLAIEVLGPAQRGDGVADHLPRHAEATRHHRRFSHRLFEAFDAAKTAPRRPGEMAPPLGKVVAARLGEPHAQLDAIL